MRPRRAAGFTLLELLLTLAIFVIMAMIVIDVFVSSGREERRGVLRSESIGTSRNTLEMIARDVRLGTVDYDFYTDNTIALSAGVNVSPVSELVLKMADQTRVFYRCIQRGDTSGIATTDQPCPFLNGEIQRSLNGAILNWEPLTVENVEIKSLLFYITPPTDPALSGATDLRQPQVTIVLTTRGLGSSESSVTSTLQTTVSSRLYVR